VSGISPKMQIKVEVKAGQVDEDHLSNRCEVTEHLSKNSLHRHHIKIQKYHISSVSDVKTHFNGIRSTFIRYGNGFQTAEY
jgi:hypothetical protein